MSLFEAKPVDVRKERRNKALWILLIVLAIAAAGLAFWFRHWPEERVVNAFFEAVERKDYERAYAIWLADEQWKQHPDKYKDYGYGQFELDWGPAGEYGTIHSHKVEGAVEPPSKTGTTTGIVVVVTVNDRAEPACLWVEKRIHTISYSPLACRK